MGGGVSLIGPPEELCSIAFGPRAEETWACDHAVAWAWYTPSSPFTICRMVYLPKEPTNLCHPGPGAQKAFPDASGPHDLHSLSHPSSCGRQPPSLKTVMQSCSLSPALEGNSDLTGVAPFVYMGQALHVSPQASDADLTA